MLVLGRARCVVFLSILLTFSISMHRFVTRVGLALLLESLQRQMALAEGMVGLRGQVGMMHMPSTTYNLHTCFMFHYFPVSYPRVPMYSILQVVTCYSYRCVKHVQR